MLRQMFGEHRHSRDQGISGLKTHRSFYAGEHKVSLIESKSSQDLRKAHNVANIHKRVMSGENLMNLEGLDVIREKADRRRLRRIGNRTG